MRSNRNFHEMLQMMKNRFDVSAIGNTVLLISMANWLNN